MPKSVRQDTTLDPPEDLCIFSSGPVGSGVVTRRTLMRDLTNQCEITRRSQFLGQTHQGQTERFNQVVNCCPTNACRGNLKVEVFQASTNKPEYF